jgi:hypothetical protein
MKLLRRILLGLAGVVLLLAAVAAIAYASDAAVGARVTGKTEPCRPFGGNEVTVQALFGITATVTGVPYTECLAVNAGNHVVYHIRSGRTSLYTEEGGRCIYDSEGGVGGCP